MKIEELSLSPITESSLSRVLSHVHNRYLGMISASRGENTPEQNDKATRELKNDIRSAGFGFINVLGSYIENAGTEEERKVSERSFLVIGKNENG